MADRVNVERITGRGAVNLEHAPASFEKYSHKICAGGGGIRGLKVTGLATRFGSDASVKNVGRASGAVSPWVPPTKILLFASEIAICF